MDVVIFMGHHKVGSSSLQRFLASNWLALARAGILYPSVESQGVAHNLARAMSGEDTPVGGLLNVREPHNALAFRLLSELSDHVVPPWHPGLPASHQMFLMIRRQVRQLSPRAVILCSEVMANFGARAPEALERIRDAFPNARFRILCTLRRPDEYLTSWHNQRLKFGHQLRPLRAGGLRPYWGGIHFDYRLMLGDWLDVFPEAEFVVRDYRDVLASGGAPPDFLAHAGLAFPEGLVDVGDANPSLPLAVMEIVRRANHALPAEDARALRDLLIAQSGSLDLAANAEVEMYGPEVRARLARNFEPVHDWLGRRLGRAPFFPDIEEVAALRPAPELEAARRALESLRALPALRDEAEGPGEAARRFVETLTLED